MTFVVKRNKDNKYLGFHLVSPNVKRLDWSDVIFWTDNIDNSEEFTTMKAAVDVIHIVLKGEPGEYSVMRVIRN